MKKKINPFWLTLAVLLSLAALALCVVAGRGGVLHLAPNGEAQDAAVSLRQIEERQQAPDHPILWNVPETEYLKFCLFQVV